jgi:type II secretory pathway pseudopilin PulG
VVVFACIIPFIAVLGILAAIALPAYQDYTIRAKITEVDNSANMTMQAIETFVIENQKWPVSASEIGLNQESASTYIESIRVEEGVVYVTPNQNIAVTGEIIYVPSSTQNGISWSCTESTVEPRYLPKKCR